MTKKYSKINELILTFFYCGKAKKAPGTFGTIGAMLFWFFINDYFVTNNYPIIIQFFFWIILTILLCAYSFHAIPKYHLIKNSKDIDHKSIVVDEAVGIFIALEIFNFSGRDIYILNQPKFMIYLFLCFILFRFFDIKKPWIIGICDRKIKNSFGVMFDDIMCGIIAGVITLVVYKFTLNSQFFSLINCQN
jgi:phosphatidylglycerophosphatase A